MRYAFLLVLQGSAFSLDASGAVSAKQGIFENQYGGRTVLVYVPSGLHVAGTRALVIVLHGGLGNTQLIQSGKSEHGLNMNAVAERGDFIVAYLNGTPVTRFHGVDKLGWNSGGGCCGQPAERDVDDFGYISKAIDQLVDQYGIDRRRIYGMGHSNGAMMTQRFMCETGPYAAAIALSGTLILQSGNFPAARGIRNLTIRGADDENAPVVGGRGRKGMSRAVYNSEARGQQAFIGSGASYNLQVVKGADHNLDNIEHAIQRTENQSIAEKSARFFGLIE